MASISPTLAARLGRPERSSSNGFITSSNAAQSAEATSSGVSWAAVVVGAVVAAAMGGYLEGSLRTQWTGVHNDEVYFRGARCARLCSEVL